MSDALGSRMQSSVRVSADTRATPPLVPGVLCAVAVLLGGCGPAQPEPVLPTAVSASDEAADPEENAPVDELRLGLTEWSIETGEVVLRPGEVTVHVTNTGGTRHDVAIHSGDEAWATPVLNPGETHVLVVTAVAGEELHLVCTVTGHESQGMHTSIHVADG